VTSPTAGTSSFALLTDGSTVEIRAAGPPDAEAVREMHAAMSPDNIYLRFFSLSPRAADVEARRVTRQPGPDHAALLAWLGTRLVGVASYESTGKPDAAEIAFAVPDDMHRRGIATLLLEHLVSLARRHGPVDTTATVSGETFRACLEAVGADGRRAAAVRPGRRAAGRHRGAGRRPAAGVQARRRPARGCRA
jgi:GNAT superfamily N-acetyltransferase